MGEARPRERLTRRADGRAHGRRTAQLLLGRAAADAAAKAKPAREIPVLEPGDRVVHDSFGMGTVVSLEGSGGQDGGLDRLRVEGVKGVKRLYGWS